MGSFVVATEMGIPVEDILEKWTALVGSNLERGILVVDKGILESMGNFDPVGEVDEPGKGTILAMVAEGMILVGKTERRTVVEGKILVGEVGLSDHSCWEVQSLGSFLGPCPCSPKAQLMGIPSEGSCTR